MIYFTTTPGNSKMLFLLKALLLLGEQNLNRSSKHQKYSCRAIFFSICKSRWRFVITNFEVSNFGVQSRKFLWPSISLEFATLTRITLSANGLLQNVNENEVNTRMFNTLMKKQSIETAVS